MADEEKTEQPTSKKIEKAREEGNVPKSQDVSSLVTLFVAVTMLMFVFSGFRQRITNLYYYYQDFIGTTMSVETVYSIVLVSIREVFFMIIPIASAIALAGVIAAILQFGFLFTTKAIKPDLKKINPISGLKNLFSLKKAVDALKTIIKVSAVFAVAFYYLLSFLMELPHTIFFNIFEQLRWLQDKLLILVSVMLFLFLIIAIADFFWTRYQYTKSLKMSKQEVKDEFKQSEGDPQIKSRIKQVQFEMFRKRMMQEVPQADVVITNPTHYAVAIKYEQGKDVAPIVVAKGVNLIAIKIKEIALNHNIQIIENPPLARELYKLCKIDQAIPRNLYQAVAEVLAFVYQQKDKK